MTKTARKQAGIALLLALLCALLAAQSVHADTGPKPGITVVVRNPPENAYYLDLLVSGEWEQVTLPEDEEEKTLLGIGLIGAAATPDWNKVEKLQAYNEGGKYAALSVDRLRYRGPYDMMSGTVLGRMNDNGDVVHRFGYIVPSRFALILVTAEGEVRTTETVTKLAYDQTFYYDFESGAFTSESVWLAWGKGFAYTFSVTLLVEGLLFFLLGFRRRRSWLVFLTTNFVTQGILTVFVNYNAERGSFLYVWPLFFLAEVIVVLLEYAAYRKWLREGSGKRHLFFAVAGNILSLAAGVVIAHLS